MWRWFFIVCILFLSSVSCDPAVQTTKGVLRGRTLKSRDGRDYYSFTGIPYAKPPIDDLRFQPPQPIDAWEGILDATKDAKMCIQNNRFFFSLKNLTFGQEDCLYLNVHTPNSNGNLPVMFWIHGGGFLSGYGGLYGPEYFMDKNVVFVSINYRLGLFGFISTEDDVIPGNYGMKDQVLALRWVRENIAKFGGDPERVTIFGESAGGASVGYHLMSRMSKGLFHKAILQSGTPVCRWAFSAPGVLRKRTEAVATIAGCYADTSLDILSCLKKLPASYIVELSNKFFEWMNHPCLAFHPVVESCNSDQEAFLCNHPITDFKQESIVPIIIGLNSAEGGIFVSSLYNDTSIKPEIHTDFNRLMASLLMYKHVSLPEHWDEIADKVKKMYFPSGKIDDHTHKNAVDMIGDGLILHCTVDMSKNLSPPVYFYLYDYQNEFSFNKLYGECGKPLGVTHGDEMISLFPLKVIFPDGLKGNDAKVSKLMVNIWFKFASSRTPTVDGTDNGAPWPEITSNEESSILHIDSEQPKIVKNPFEEKHKFWSELPLLSNLNKHKLSKKSNTKNEL